MNPFSIEISPDEVLDRYSAQEILKYLIDNVALVKDDLELIMNDFSICEIVSTIRNNNYPNDPALIYKALGEALKKGGLI